MRAVIGGNVGRALCAAAALLLAVLGPPSRAAPSGNSPGGEVFARVGEHVVTLDEFQAALAAGMRQKYYHGRPPEAELARFQREVAEQLIDEVLLLAEARRRGLEADAQAVQEQLSAYERRYGASAQWQARREKWLPGLAEQLRRRSLLQRLEQQVKAAPEPDEAQLRAYYESHRDLFTEPEQVRLSLILLKVDPSSPESAWQGAAAEAARLRRRLEQGGDFGELARVHSADPSASRGGDLGYVHRGMLPESLQNRVIDALAPGAVSPPVRLLEGVALVRLEERKPARLRPFAEVRQRAAELWARDQGERAWRGLIVRLRSGTEIRIDESRFTPISSR
jgi:parvulin-like peptidyl-prolyl isomerase